MMRGFVGFLALALLWVFAAASGASEQSDEYLKKARAECSEFTDEELEVGDDFPTLVDLTGDGKDDVVIDPSKLYCPGAASLFCGGSAGCPITIVADGTTTETYTQGWKVIGWLEQPILLLALHGTRCGGIGAMRCIEALVWDDGAFRSVAGN